MRFPVICSLLALLCFSSVNISVSAQSKAKLHRENTELKGMLDSLNRKLEQYHILLEEKEIQLDSALNRLEKIDSERGRGIYGNYDKEFSDSMLTHWYMMSEEENYILEDIDSLYLQSNIPDSVYIQKLRDMNSFIKLAYNDVVRKYIILYTQKYRNNMGKLLALCDFYLPMFKECFNRHGLPEELAVMAVIESRLNPRATSWAGAKGMWQFMYPTAKKYGLTINSFVDERMDVAKSVEAAARYLRDAYKIFGDWNLAISSYNCGAGNVRKAIARSGGKTGFWDIYPYLPRETRGYVPAFVGALYAIHYQSELGMKAEALDMPVHIDTFHINRMLHFRQLADVVGVKEDDLRKLNPQYCHDIIPGNKGQYILRLPYEFSEKYIESEDSVYRYMADSLFSPLAIKKIEDGVVGNGERILYRVKSGDTLSGIAHRYHVTVAKLQKWNNLRSTNLSIGQKLYIYQGR